MNQSAERLGIDLGSSNVKLSLLGADGDERRSLCVACQGQPLAALEDALGTLARQQGQASPVRTAVTGVAQQLLGDSAQVASVNEIVAAATAVRAQFPAARSAIDLGGQLSKWIVLPGGADGGAVVDFGTNGLCAAGSGAFLEQQAGRLRKSVAELGQLAAAAARGVPIAGRCSVFAKSDMIHQQQKGTPTEEIALGVCLALARTFLNTTLGGRRLEPPVVLVGGGAANPGLVRAFAEELGLTSGEQVVVPSDPVLTTARGAALLAGEGARCELSDLLEAVRRARAGAVGGGSVSLLSPLGAGARDGGRPEEPPTQPGVLEAFLGVDVGSVSTNLVLLSPEAEVLQGIYLPTRGQPVAVLNEGLARIRARYGDRLRVIGVGTTGSGRHLAARVLGADAVHNEISAQLLAAAHCVPDVDTVFEIGGQDSKYIAAREGRLVDFEMNKICAAGTGSFLEEQADRLGVQIVGQFADLALEARAPVDLGTRCTVFMDAELVRAQRLGTPRADLCAGLAYSVARNYLDRVVAGRPVGRRVVFQGGTASNTAVVAAFEALLGTPVTVHPYNRISGAIGAGLLAAKAHAATGYQTRFLGLSACIEPSVKSFECRRCDNRCEVSRIALGERVVHFGDTCDRYTERDREQDDGRRPFPELFATRARLLEAHTAERLAGPAGRTPIGLPRASPNLELLPLWTAFLRQLDYEPVLSSQTSSRMLSTRGGGVPAEVCAPVKVAAAHIRELVERGEVERVFAPSVIECGRPPGDDEAVTCLYTQQIGDMARSALGKAVVAPQVLLGEPGLGDAVLARELGQALDRSPGAVARALDRGRAVQAAFSAARQAAGLAAQAAIDDGFAVLVIGRPYALHDPFVNLSLARHLHRAGLPAIPLDMLPLDDVRLDRRWDTVPWLFSRQQLRAVELLRRDPRLIPLVVSCFGCGVDGFVVKHLEELLDDRPRLILEFDEHRAEAGLVTRLEAFADEIGEHRRLPRAARPARRRTPGATHRAPGRRFFVPDVGHVTGIYAAALRSGGGETILLPPADEASLQLGEAYASGRECHPWTAVAGELVRWLRGHRAGPDDVFVALGCLTPCLMRQYGDAFRSLIERVELPRVKVWDVFAGPLEDYFGTAQALRFYGALLSADILYILATRLRPYERSAGQCDLLLEQGLRRIADAVETRRSAAPALERSVRELWQARGGQPGDLPVVGVTGDLYTRLHPLANAGLFARLEAMGCEVWPSPYFIDLFDLESHIGLRDMARRVEPAGLYFGLKAATCAQVRRAIVRRLPAAVRPLVLEPSPREMMRLARPLLGPRTHFLVVNAVAKLADFVERGAAGAITAAGLNCMVGVSATAALPVIRAEYGDVPLLSLVYGGGEGPAQRIRLETFVHQVKARWELGGTDGRRAPALVLPPAPAPAMERRNSKVAVGQGRRQVARDRA